ncbi:MAG: ScpA family protein [Gemmatimonadaceae bacterium]
MTVPAIDLPGRVPLPVHRHADPAAFVVDLDAFAGPLDLLLSLIRDEKVDIYDIPIARIAEQFLARLHDLALNDAAEYLEMAARLLRIKVQVLMPRPEGVEPWEDPRAELVRRLLEYQQMREVVDVLERHAEDRRSRFARRHGEPHVTTLAPGRLALSLGDLFGAVDRVLRRAREPQMHDVVPRALDLDGAMMAIRAVIASRARVRWPDVARRDAEPWQVLSTLLALCELARRGELRLVQRRPFSSLDITRDPAGAAA